MPELPEIEIVKRSLLKIANKAKIINIKINNKDLRYQIPHNFSSKLIGEKIVNISRRSKYLIFYFKKKMLLLHLGMSGKLLLLRSQDKKLFKTSFYYNLNILEKHNHIFFKLNNGYTIIYNDVRRFGFLKIYDSHQFSKIPFLKKLGLEPFNSKFNETYFKNFLANKKKNIKNLLMDQTFVSGLGNIYVNEILFKAKVNPTKSSGKLNNKEIKKIIFYTKKTLKFSISKGGSSIKDFKNTDGRSGEFQQFFHVYERENMNCSRNSCRGKIKRIVISNRSTFYCNRCQN